MIKLKQQGKERLLPDEASTLKRAGVDLDAPDDKQVVCLFFLIDCRSAPENFMKTLLR